MCDPLAGAEGVHSILPSRTVLSFTLHLTRRHSDARCFCKHGASLSLTGKATLPFLLRNPVHSLFANMIGIRGSWGWGAWWDLDLAWDFLCYLPRFAPIKQLRFDIEREDFEFHSLGQFP